MLESEPGGGKYDQVRNRTPLSKKEVNMKVLSSSTLNRRTLLSVLAGLSLLSGPGLTNSAFAQTDPLPSWNDGPAKQAIVEFVQATTDQGKPDFVPPEARIATFDQDGTLWVEHPMYSQVIYCLDRVPGGGQGEGPSCKDIEPFKTVLSGNREAIAKLPMRDLEKILIATLTGMSVEEFTAEVEEVARHRQGSALEPALHRADLPADAGGADAICAPTATRPTSSPAAARISCASMPSRSTAFRPSR